jgi:hypothetical protein
MKVILELCSPNSSRSTLPDLVVPGLELTIPYCYSNVVIQQVLDYENTLMPLPTLSEAERPDARDS